MYSMLIPVVFALFVITVTIISYRLGQTKSDNARMAALIGFLLSFLPPLAMIYLVVLSLKEDAATV